MNSRAFLERLSASYPGSAACSRFNITYSPGWNWNDLLAEPGILAEAPVNLQIATLAEASGRRTSDLENSKCTCTWTVIADKSRYFAAYSSCRSPSRAKKSVVHGSLLPVSFASHSPGFPASAGRGKLLWSWYGTRMIELNRGEKVLGVIIAIMGRPECYVTRRDKVTRSKIVNATSRDRLMLARENRGLIDHKTAFLWIILMIGYVEFYTIL